MTTRTAEQQDDYENNLVAAGAVLALFIGMGFGSLDTVEVVLDADGNVTNQIDITLSFLRSPYRITVERLDDRR